MALSLSKGVSEAQAMVHAGTTGFDKLSTSVCFPGEPGFIGDEAS